MRAFLKLRGTLLLTVALVLLAVVPAQGEKLTIMSLEGPFHGTEEEALDLCPDQNGNFYLLTVESLFFYDAHENRLESIADNDQRLKKVVTNSGMIAALAEDRAVYRLEKDHWEFVTRIPDAVDGLGAYKGCLEPAAGRIALSEEQLFFFYDDEEGNPFLCAYRWEDGTFAYMGIPFVTNFCAYNGKEHALVGVIRVGNQDWMAQYDLTTDALTALFPVEYPGYIVCYDSFNNRAISGSRSGIILTLESGKHLLMDGIPGTADLHVIDKDTIACVQYMETTAQEVALYRYDLSSATAFQY